VTKPGAYDVDAIKLLYGLSTATPAQPFCTDEDTTADVHCNRFDYPGDPLTKTYIPLYQGFLTQFLTGQTPSAPTTRSTTCSSSCAMAPRRLDARDHLGVERHHRTGARPAAGRAGLEPELRRARGLHGPPRAVAPVPRRPDAARQLRGDPTTGNPAFPAIFNEVVANLNNVDGVRSFTTRRAMVDILAHLQLSAAYDALVQSRAAYVAQRSSLTGAAGELTDDLIARIDSVTHPYFK